MIGVREVHLERGADREWLSVFYDAEEIEERLQTETAHIHMRRRHIRRLKGISGSLVYPFTTPLRQGHSFQLPEARPACKTMHKYSNQPTPKHVSPGHVQKVHAWSQSHSCLNTQTPAL